MNERESLSQRTKMESSIEPTPAEFERAGRWMAENLQPGAATLPFSFLYGGKRGGELLANWAQRAERSDLDKDRTRHTLTWRDGKSGLEVRCVSVEYADFPVVEWTVYFRNTGQEDTPLLEDIQGLDIHFESQGEFVLHHNRGDTCGPNAYQPMQQTLIAGSDARFAPVGGRPTSLAFPYFNVQDGGQGTMIALGWPGQWAARFTAEGRGRLRIQGGQELTHLRLLPGEEVRTPLAVLMFWEGDILCSQNSWRHWMFAHNLPRRQQQLPPPVSAMCAGVHQNEAGEKEVINLLVRHDAKVDYWWMDAGWYPGTPGPMGEWTQAGTWQPDAERFPGGIKAVADFAHARGMRLVLWFELERVSPGSAWREHPEWLLALRPEDRRFRLRPDIGSPEFTMEEAERNQIREDDRLYNLGDPEAQRFLTDYVSRCIGEWGIDDFRLDFNIAPLLFWRAADAPERQGMTENRYVCGLLAFLDELRARHPQLLIDSCASGGRRIDLETLRRAVVYTRSDYWNFSTTGDQCQTAGIASWVPHYLCTTTYDDTYRYRSNLAPCMEFHFDFSRLDQVNWELLRQRLTEWRGLADLYYGDYYPLSGWNNREDGRLAWQFNRPKEGDGIVQVFRRRDCDETTQVLRLHDLDEDGVYDLTDLDVPTQRTAGLTMIGKELMEDGLTVCVASRPGAAIITYKRRNPDAKQ